MSIIAAIIVGFGTGMALTGETVRVAAIGGCIALWGFLFAIWVELRGIRRHRTR